MRNNPDGWLEEEYDFHDTLQQVDNVVVPANVSQFVEQNKSQNAGVPPDRGCWQKDDRPNQTDKYRAGDAVIYEDGQFRELWKLALDLCGDSPEGILQWP